MNNQGYDFLCFKNYIKWCCDKCLMIQSDSEVSNHSHINTLLENNNVLKNDTNNLECVIENLAQDLNNSTCEFHDLKITVVNILNDV